MSEHEHLRRDLCGPHEGLPLARVEELLGFLRTRLAAPDYAEACELLHACASPAIAALRAGRPAPEEAEPAPTPKRRRNRKE